MTCLKLDGIIAGVVVELRLYLSAKSLFLLVDMLLPKAEVGKLSKSIQVVNSKYFLALWGHMVSVITTHLCHCNIKAAVDST